MSVNLNDNGTLKRIAGGTFYADAPVGTIQAYGGAIDSTHQAPSGWLLCDGSEKNIDDFADLYAVIGDAFGTPSVNTKFVLPDLRGEFLRGAGNNSHTNQGNGGTVGQHQDATMLPYNQVSQSDVRMLKSQYVSNYDYKSSPDNAVVYSSNWQNAETPNGEKFTTRPTNTSVNYIIKAKQTALPVDLASEVDEKLTPKLVASHTPSSGETWKTALNALFAELTINQSKKYRLIIHFGSLSVTYEQERVADDKSYIGFSENYVASSQSENVYVKLSDTTSYFIMAVDTGSSTAIQDKSNQETNGDKMEIFELPF